MRDRRAERWRVVLGNGHDLRLQVIGQREEQRPQRQFAVRRQSFGDFPRLRIAVDDLDSTHHDGGLYHGVDVRA